jgi:hypothetical protein
MKLFLEIEYSQVPSGNPLQDDDEGSICTFSPSQEGRRGFSELEPVISGVLVFAEGVAAGVVANWIWSKLQGKATRLFINKTVVHMSVVSIEKVIIDARNSQNNAVK